MTSPGGCLSVLESRIRPDELMGEQARCLAADVRWLQSRRAEFVEVPCPACGDNRDGVHWRKRGLLYRLCPTCYTVYMSPRPSSELLDEFYRTSRNYEFWNREIFPASEQARREEICRPRAERIAALSDGDSLLDVGAGFGTFCEEAERFFSDVVALEPEPHLAETCRSKGLCVVQLPVEKVRLTADVVTAFEVIEHLFDPRAFIRHCAELLPAGGLLVLTCPNVKSYEIEMLGPKSSSVDHEHLNYFHPDSLTNLVESEGFTVVELTTPGKLDIDIIRKAGIEPDLTQEDLIQQRRSTHMWMAARR